MGSWAHTAGPLDKDGQDGRASGTGGRDGRVYFLKSMRRICFVGDIVLRNNPPVFFLLFPSVHVLGFCFFVFYKICWPFCFFHSLMC